MAVLASKSEGPSARILRKLEGSVAPRTQASASDVVVGALKAMESVIGVGSISFPPKPDGEWFARTANFIRSRGYTNEMFRTAAHAARIRGDRLPLSFDKTVWNLENMVRVSERRASAPVRMDDL